MAPLVLIRPKSLWFLWRIRKRFELAGQLWELGGWRSAWMIVWPDFERDAAALPPVQRLEAAVQLARMMEQDGSAKRGAQVLHRLEALASQSDLPPELRFKFWELNARCLVWIGDVPSAVAAIGVAISLAPDPAARAKLSAMLAEFYFLQGEIDKALEAATTP